MVAPLISVVIPAHNPHPGRLRETLHALSRQALPAAQWETLLVDNASTRFPSTAELADVSPPNLRVSREERLGLTFARIHGFRAARADLAVLVDDDNVIDESYLANVIRIFAANPAVGLAGGRSLPRFEKSPPDWVREFHSLLALRDLGSQAQVSNGLQPNGAPAPEYPACAPIGAGMAIRRAAWEAWMRAREGGPTLSDRRGKQLTSGGDNDIIFCAMEAGWEVGYFPELSLQHLIPAERLEPEYLARLNRGIQKSWMEVLSAHGANRWPRISRAGAALRKVKAWITYRPWSDAAARIRWHGACGHFEGRVTAEDRIAG